MAPAARLLLALALLAASASQAGCIGRDPPFVPQPAPPPDAAPSPEVRGPPTPAGPPPVAMPPPAAPEGREPAPTAPAPAPAPTEGPSGSPTPPSAAPPSSGTHAGGQAPTAEPAVPERPVRLRGGSDAAPDRTGARVPTYTLAADGSALAAHVVAVRDARLVVDSFLRIENLDVRARTATLSGEARNATGVTEARLELWRSASGASLGTLDLLAPGASLALALEPGEVVDGRYAITVGSSGGDGFEARLALAVPP